MPAQFLTPNSERTADAAEQLPPPLIYLMRDIEIANGVDAVGDSDSDVPDLVDGTKSSSDSMPPTQAGPRTTSPKYPPAQRNW